MADQATAGLRDASRSSPLRGAARDAADAALRKTLGAVQRGREFMRDINPILPGLASMAIVGAAGLVLLHAQPPIGVMYTQTGGFALFNIAATDFSATAKQQPQQIYQLIGQLTSRFYLGY